MRGIQWHKNHFAESKDKVAAELWKPPIRALCSKKLIAFRWSNARFSKTLHQQICGSSVLVTNTWKKQDKKNVWLISPRAPYFISYSLLILRKLRQIKYSKREDNNTESSLHKHDVTKSRYGHDTASQSHASTQTGTGSRLGDGKGVEGHIATGETLSRGEG